MRSGGSHLSFQLRVLRCRESEGDSAALNPDAVHKGLGDSFRQVRFSADENREFGDATRPNTTVVDSEQIRAAGSNQAGGIGVFGSGRRWPGVGGPDASWTSRGRVAGCVFRATADG